MYVLVIANKPQQPAYFSALLPNDQVFDDDPDETEIPVPSKKIKKEVQIKEDFDENEEQENEEEEEEVNNGDESDIKVEEPIDNPFLRPVKYPVAP